jgi:Protein of unknown function (DUF2783)
MTHLRRGDGFDGRGDAFYEQLIAAHRDLDDAASGALNARLVLLLANQVGDLAILAEAIAAARHGLGAHDSVNEQER